MMKFNKMTAAMVLAGIAAAPLAQAEVTLSGQVAIGILGSDADDIDAIDIGDILPDGSEATAADVVSAASPSELTVFGDDSIINVNATGTLDNGLTGYANYRTDLGLVGDNAVGDNIHLGIRGDFGDIRIGEVPDATGFGQLAGDIGGTQIGSDIDGENFGISYTGTFAGATVGVNWSPEGSSDRFAAGAKYSIAGFGVGIGFGDDAGRSEFSVGATFALAGASAGLAYKDFDDDRQTISGTIGYGIGKTSLGATFETETGDVNDGDLSLRFDAGYDLGSGMNVSGRVNVFTDDSDDSGDITDYRLLLVKSF